MTEILRTICWLYIQYSILLAHVYCAESGFCTLLFPQLKISVGHSMSTQPTKDSFLN